MGETVFIDGNIFLEIFLRDKKAEECAFFLKSLQGKNIAALTSDFIVYSSLLVIQSKIRDQKLMKMKNALRFFNSYSNLLIMRPSFDDIYDAIEFMESSKLDFYDSLVVVCMKKHDVSKLVSLDKHFDKIREIKRIKP